MLRNQYLDYRFGFLKIQPYLLLSTIKYLYQAFRSSATIGVVKGGNEINDTMMKSKVHPTTTPKGEFRWMIQFNSLKKYLETQQGNRRITMHHVTAVLEDGSRSNLGNWLDNQRQKLRKGTLIDHRRILFQELLTTSKLKLNDDQSWMEHYNAIIAYTKQNNNINYHFAYTFKITLPDDRELPLGRWLRNQRLYIRRGTLRSDRKALLQDLIDKGLFTWKCIEGNYNDDMLWNTKYEALIKYGEENGGDCNVTTIEKVKLSDGSIVRIGKWLHTNREMNKKGKLRSYRKEKLQALVDAGKLVWGYDLVELKTDDIGWNENYAAVLKYGQEHGGNCNVPSLFNKKLPDNKTNLLGRWLSAQRLFFKKNELREDRKALLQELVDAGKFKWNINVGWEVRYNSLLEYAKQHGGTCEIPFYNYRSYDHGYDDLMGLWFRSQKIYYKKGTLMPERARKLQLLVDQGMMTWENKI
eukprot:gene2388-4635_t